MRVLTEDCLAEDVVAVGARFERFVTAPNRASRHDDLIRDWEARTPLGASASGRDRVMTGPASPYAHDTRAALERAAVDAMVCDYMLFGPPIAAERAGVPQALIVHNIYMVPEPGKPAPEFRPCMRRQMRAARSQRKVNIKQTIRRKRHHVGGRCGGGNFG